MKDIRIFLSLNFIIFLILALGCVFFSHQWLKSDLLIERVNTKNALTEAITSEVDLQSARFQSLTEQYQLSFISSQLAVNNTIAELGLAQHWLISSSVPELTSMETLAVGRYIVKYKPSYHSTCEQALDKVIHLLILIIAALTLSNIACLLTISSLRRRLHSFVITEKIKPTKHPIMGSVGQLIQEQKLRLSEQINEQKQIIKNLESQINVDPLTGQYNRHSFREKLLQLITERPRNTAIFLIRTSQLQEINKLRGHLAGDEYIQDLANLIDQCRLRYNKESFTYRLLGADFALIIEQVPASHISDIAEELKEGFNIYSQKKNLQSCAYTGVTELLENDHIERVIGRTEAAVSIAQTLAPNSWQMILDDQQEDEHGGEQQWLNTINSLIDKKSYKLAVQNIQTLQRTSPAYNEVFIRFISQDQTLPTDTTLIMAQRLEVKRLEFSILDFIFAQLSAQLTDNRWGINLSRLILIEGDLVSHLKGLIERHPDLRNKLVFELEEQQLEAHITSAKRLFELLRQLGCYTTISDFGSGIGSFKLFKILKPNFIKLNNELVSQIETDKTSQQFVRMIIETSHRIGCRVVAQGVETLEQKQALEAMYIDGLQGYLIAKPQLL